MEKMNHFVCPMCGHDFFAPVAYATCDGCQTMFYVAQSATVRRRINTDDPATNPYDLSAGNKGFLGLCK